MVKKLLLSPTITPATLTDYPTVANLWRFYVYDMGRYCGFTEGWEDPTQLSFVPDDLTNYFTDKARKAYLIKINEELAGFIFLNTVGRLPETQWAISEFFITAKFQGKGIGKRVVHQIWNIHPGRWELSVMPENKSALTFWRKAIATFTNHQYSEEIKRVDCRGGIKAERYMLSFDATKL